MTKKIQLIKGKCLAFVLTTCLLFFIKNTSGQVDSLRQLIATTVGKEKMINLLELGFIFAMDPNTAKEARDLSTVALEMADLLPDSDLEKQRRQFWAQENISLASIRLSDFGQAQKAAVAALGLARAMPDSLGTMREARAYLQLAEIYHWQGQHEKQIVMLQEAAEVFDQTNNVDDWAVAQNNLGMAYFNLEIYDSALVCLQACDPVFENWGGGMDLPNKIILTNVMQELGNWERADQLIDTVLANAPTEGFPDIAYAWVAKGKNLQHFGQFPKSLEAFRRAQTHIFNLKEPNARANFYEEFAAAFEDAGELDSALLYLKKYKMLEDTLQHELFGKNLADAQARFEVDEKMAKLEEKMSKKQQRSNLRLAISAALFLVLTATGFWYLFQKKKKEVEAAARTLTISLEATGREPSEAIDPLLNDFLGRVQNGLGEESLSVENIAQAMKMSRVQLFKKVKKASGASPSEIIRQYRLEAGKKLLLEKTLTVSQIAYQVGFSNPNSFSRAFKEKFGTSPSIFLAKKKEV